MTVSSTTSRVSYAGNGSTTVFSVPFYFLSSSDLVVIRTIGATQTTLVLSTDYTVSGAGTPSGGSITCTSAPVAGSTIVIYRDPAATQLVDYQANDPFPAETHEAALDKLTMLVQRVKDLIGRSFTLSDGDVSGASTKLPSPEANKLVGWNASASGLQNVDSATLATLVAYGTANADIFTGDGATVTFTLTANPGVGPNLDVSVGGVTQIIGVNYTWSGGTSITFTSAPGVGVKVLARYMQGLPTSYSAPITITASAGTAVFTGTDGTRSLTLTPNTTNVINSIGGGVNISIGGVAALQVGSSRNVTVAAPASGVAFTVNGIAGTHSTKIADSAGNSLNAGYLETPILSKSAAYTAVLEDSGKTIYYTGSSSVALTIPANGSVAYPIGTVLTFVNDASAAVSVTIPINTDTLVWASGGTTGTRTLARYGMATAVKVTSTRWVISGTGLS